jgi:hypothetical protein
MRMLKMKLILLSIGILMAIARCYSQQQTTFETNVWSSHMLCTNSDGEVLINPAPPEVLEKYKQDPDPYGTNELESIAMGYLFQTNAQQAIVVLQRLLKKDPNNKGTILWLGRCYMLNKQPEAAIDVLKTSSKMGDDESVLTLAEIYCFLVANYQELTPLIPKIVEIRKQTKDGDERHDASVVLLAYLVREDTVDGGDKILSQSLDGLRDKYIVANPDIASLAIPALEKYHQLDWANELRNEVNIQTNTSQSELDESTNAFLKLMINRRWAGF